MGLQARIVLYARDRGEAADAARAAFARIAELDEILSDYRTSSELMRLADRAGTGPVPVSDDLLRVLLHADTLARRTGGAFDVTAAPLVRRWREARRTGRLPHPDSLAADRARVGPDRMRIDPGVGTVALAPGTRLDLGGIAKGYAVDAALATLRRAGVPRALVELGGDLAVGAPPPGARGWRVEIAHPGEGPRVLVLHHAAVSSSGDTEQFVEIDGRRYSHVVDPAAGVGLTTRTAATVVAPRGVTADGLSTLLTVLDRSRGEAYLRAFHPDVRAFVRQVE